MLKITPENGIIGISAMSGYGKTYLATTILKKGLQAGYKLYVLSYSLSIDKTYWDELKKYGDTNITSPESFSISDLITFIYKAFSDKKGGKIIYIQDLNFYLDRAGNSEILSFERLLTSMRKVNSIFIYEVSESIQGSKLLSLLDDTDILFIGRFGRDQETLFKHLGINKLEELYNEIKNHEFLMINLDTKVVNIVKVVGNDLIEVPENAYSSDEDEYY